MFIDTIPNRKSPPAVLLRESYREGGRVKKRTLANLSKLPQALIEGIAGLLDGGKVAGKRAAEPGFEIVRSLPHGHVAAVQAMIRKLGLNQPENGLATEDLRHLYLGVRTAFPNRAPVLLVALPTLRERFYAAALGMQDAQFRRYWMGLVFSGDSALPPVEVGTVDAVKQLVARHPGAVGFIDAAAADASVKVITIDGLRPDEPGYPLR